MRVLVIADIDDLHWKHGYGNADVLLSCGDVSDQLILEAADAYDCRHILAVKGNHDNNGPFEKPIIDLHCHFVEHEKISFVGLNGSWKYKPRGHFLYEQCEAESLVSNLPAADILLTHNSPRGVHDKEDNVHHGFNGLNSYILSAKPKMIIHGHQHVDRESTIAQTRVIGVYGYRIIEI